MDKVNIRNGSLAILLELKFYQKLHISYYNQVPDVLVGLLMDKNTNLKTINDKHLHTENYEMNGKQAFEQQVIRSFY